MLTLSKLKTLTKLKCVLTNSKIILTKILIKHSFFVIINGKFTEIY